MSRDDTRIESRGGAVAAVRTADGPGARPCALGGSVASHDSA